MDSGRRAGLFPRWDPSIAKMMGKVAASDRQYFVDYNRKAETMDPNRDRLNDLRNNQRERERLQCWPVGLLDWSVHPRAHRWWTVLVTVGHRRNNMFPYSTEVSPMENNQLYRFTTGRKHILHAAQNPTAFRSDACPASTESTLHRVAYH
ncbi:hypothetical protein LAZ67_3001009 [Cordylochernes scorpioides]|uniref:Uncharacterized protein n=1 Tax=Cordylochernes scorpioides TaxID=51811 RepID=A0ABY6K6V5_9ARAC|nr:hypothetical protein LAZ67_3001009 [Cordylochernes scorpioides]